MITWEYAEHAPENVREWRGKIKTEYKIDILVSEQTGETPSVDWYISIRNKHRRIGTSHSYLSMTSDQAKAECEKWLPTLLDLVSK